MKTLKLYIDGVKCEFESGQFYFYPDMVKGCRVTEWVKRNLKEIRHYIRLTAKHISINKN